MAYNCWVCQKKLNPQETAMKFGPFGVAGECCMNSDKEKKAIAKKRLEYLRGEIQAERISYAGLDELQSLVEHIEEGDVELLQWAGVPEFADSPTD